MEKIDKGLKNYFGLNEQRKLNGQVYSLLLFVFVRPYYQDEF